MWLAFLHGFVLSLGLILPIGMQNGFILTQGALHRRWSHTLPAVVTAAVCDTFLIALAVLGISTAALQVVWLRYGLGAVGILFMIFMGWSTWRERAVSTREETAATAWTPRRQVVFTSSVSLLNPHALLDTLAVIGGSAVVYSAWSERMAFGAASAAVSWLWFIGLSAVGHMAGRAVLKNSSLQVINRASAVMMWVSALYLGYVIWTA